MKKDFMVVILGSDENAYGFARSFHKAYGIKPIALATTILEPTKNSKIIDFIIDSKLHDKGHLSEVLVDLGNKLKKEYKKLILIPCSDAYIEMIISIQDKLVDYENRFISFDTLKTINDKVSFYEMCEKHNLPYPKSFICTKNDYEKVIDTVDIDYPVILKPNNSNSEEYLNAHFEGKEKVYFIYNKEELINKIKTIYSSSYKDKLIIQKYVSGDDTNMRVLNVYSDAHGKVKMMSLGMPILEEYHPKTYGNYAAIISLCEHLPIMDDIKNFLESIKYKGAANFDIKKDATTGKYYIFEINPRPGRSSFFSECAGMGFGTAYVEDLVYDRLESHLDNDNEILWLNVPYSLVNRYVNNNEIMTKVKKLKRAKKLFHTLSYEKDNSLKRKTTIMIQYARKIHYFPKYYIEKK